jgi:hypothetical protein
MTRIASLHKFNGVLLGRDLTGIFENGHVYEVTKMLGVIMVRDLGEHAIGYLSAGSSIPQYATAGFHCLTKEEYNEQQRREGTEECE